jgi:hypothetical protein
MMLTRGFSPSARLALRDFFGAVLGPQPGHRAVGALPLVLVDGARQEALDVGAFRRHAAADHLGDRAGDDDAGRSGIERRVRALHRAFGAVWPSSFAQAGDDDRQLVRRQRVGVVQHRGDRQVLAADRAVDDDLQALDRGEGVDRAPIAAGAIVIEDEHQIISSALRLAWASPSAWRSAPELGDRPSACLPRRRRRGPRRRRRRRRSSRRSAPCCRARR